MPVVYNTPIQPIPQTITLSQVPYTGFDLGTVGEIAYWSFLALVALFGTYMLAFKRVQNPIAKKLSTFLFGEEETIDSFIRSQINRFN